MGTNILMALAVVLLLLNGVLLAEKSQDSDEITAKPHSGITEVRVSSGSAAGIGDRSSLQSSHLDQKNHEKHDLTSPKSFENDGVYIWCDLDGTWTIFWCGEKISELRIQISTAGVMKALNSGGSNTDIVAQTPQSFEIVGTTGLQSGIVQFVSTHSDVSFLVEVDGIPSVNQVFIGSRAISPLQPKFLLQRPVGTQIMSRFHLDESVTPLTGDNGSMRHRVDSLITRQATGSEGGGKQNDMSDDNSDQGGE